MNDVERVYRGIRDPVNYKHFEMSRPPKPCLLILGPTASGKSGLALALARRLGGVVINADSRQLYADLRILTARPSAEEAAQAPHDLYGVLPGDAVASAMWWRAQAEAALARAEAAGLVPIIVGGTGFYARALLDGLPDMPDVPDVIRDSVTARMAETGPEAAHAALAKIDPALAAALKPGDSQRIARGLAVFQASGRPLSAWQAAPPPGPPPGWAFRTVVLEPERGALYAACDGRLVTMFETGAVAEVERLRTLGLPDAAPVRQSVGVPEIEGWLDGRWDRATALRLAQADTRHYAKRQQTWFRHQLRGVEALRLAGPDPEAVLASLGRFT